MQALRREAAVCLFVLHDGYVHAFSPTIFRCSSCSWRSSTGPGAPIITSQAFLEVRGKTVHVLNYKKAESFLFDLEDSVPDAVFTDIQMPGMNGMEMIRKLREKDSEMPVVFTSGLSDFLQDGNTLHRPDFRPVRHHESAVMPLCLTVIDLFKIQPSCCASGAAVWRQGVPYPAGGQADRKLPERFAAETL